MTAAKKSEALEPTELMQLVEKIRLEICDKGNLVEIALEKVADENTVVAMLKAIGRSNNELFSLTEPLENSLEQSSLADPLDRWIKVTPETMPEHEQPVQAWSEALGRSEPAFYDSKHKFWCRLFDNGSTLLEGGVPYYRIGSLPSMAKGGRDA